MPVTLPGLSVTKAAELLQTQDRIIKSFPEVASVFGKAGRANTATDPAPVEMTETVINLKPESEWRPGMTIEKLQAEMDEALRLPGVSNAWTMPIKARIDMLATGIRTPVGVKVFGPDLHELERLATEVERVVQSVPGTTSAFAERLARRPLYRDHARPRGGRALRACHRRHSESHRHRARRRRCHDHGRRPRALQRHPALPARFSRRSAGHCVPGAGADHERRHGAARPGRARGGDARTAQHPHRERAARRLCLCRSCRAAISAAM